ncbi:hypothetical protein A3I25_02850 [Candidatus Nomurabacteria bacterium RIFCSPLOWO2_02_FULL_42_17]|uniref:Addiction module toxin RelE n=2 Tax=Candidatus Nomuraibacteriota TaxID=1752729 RepID=A0A1F6WIJ8_9BACT|nr:MAG: hypothetical protein UV08_C0018G0009 [Parcubacteria group bacterium GW2011_GWA2_42_18]OGI81535.1 MAG: hypothetical protein A3B93_02120 [Candidatus Nomurabacteria bacterium RIFCSPHIGHO2_02_FULL_42_24]OGI97592.1 MAG: hypothetical protein A3I25_02850 [Candidatus Nomurabacteria bacterium RIFCSPLOWO2_02_FULL_42_17]
MAWLIEFQKAAEVDLAKLDKEVRRQVVCKLEWLVENFENVVPQNLGGEFKDFYKLRAGDWRIKYKVNWNGKKIIVCYIDHRSRAYQIRK